MSQCVPNWDLSDPPPAYRPPYHSSSAADDVVPMFEYEVAELTWENGQLAMHGLGLPRVTGKIQHGGGGGGGGDGSKYTWENKPARASGTLEYLVNQGTRHGKIGFDVNTDNGSGGGNDLVPWFSDHHKQTLQTPAASAATTMDAMVPCDGDKSTAGGAGKATVESSDTPAVGLEDEDCRVTKRGRVVARGVHAERDWSVCKNQISVSGSDATFVPKSRQKVTLDTHNRNFAVVSAGGGLTATTDTSHGSLDNTSSGKPCVNTTTDDHDSVCHSTYQVEEEEDEGDRKKENPKSSISTKRSRAAAIHNQSERKRRDRINQRMKTLQKLVPNSNKTDKASMLDEVIEYLKQLQAQIQMMSRMNMPMMLPMAAMQQQLPMASLMAPMGMGMGMAGMGMGMALGMDHLNMMATRSGLAAGMSPILHPTAFMPVAAWDGGTYDQRQPSPTTMIADPISAFLACQPQPMTMEAYSRIATMFQQMNQQPPTVVGSKN